VNEIIIGQCTTVDFFIHVFFLSKFTGTKLCCLAFQGSDCVKPFITLQDCIKANPEAFSKEILEEEENEKEADKSNLKVRAPSWSRESNPKV
jgi:hypothetical protein